MLAVLLSLLIGGFSLPTYAVPLQTTSEFSTFQPLINHSASGLITRQKIKCDSRYGVNLDILDCRNALSQLLSGSTLITIKDREDIARGDVDTLPLPFRMMGSKLSADSIHTLLGTLNSHVLEDSALCFIQPVLVHEQTSGTVSLNQLKTAASMIVDQCAFSPGSGGIAMNIGRLDHQALYVSGTALTRAVQEATAMLLSSSQNLNHK